MFTSFRGRVLPSQISFSPLQWRFSRAVEPSASLPKDKAFSIAAALPVPCRGSLADDPPAAFLQSEERLPFSRNEKGAQHVTQQLTLLQQVGRRVQSPHLALRWSLSLVATRGRRAFTNPLRDPYVYRQLWLDGCCFRRRCSKGVIRFIFSTPESRGWGARSRAPTSECIDQASHAAHTIVNFQGLNECETVVGK